MPRYAGIVFAACVVFVSARADITIVADGTPMAVIVTADEPTQLVRYAVEELQQHLRRMSGVDLPVSTDSALDTTDQRPRIAIGDTALAKAAGLETAVLSPEATVVRTVPNALILIGGDRIDPEGRPTHRTPVGTLHAVYGFLNRDLGVEWLWPGEVGTIIPKRTTVRVSAVDRQFQPPLIQRHIRGGLRDFTGEVTQLGFSGKAAVAYTREFQRWALRRGRGRRASFAFGHAYNHWLERYGHDHPEWFAMMPDGVRVTPEHPYPNLERAKLCVTNPRLLDFIAERGITYLEQHPDVLSFSACPNDSRGYCMCPRCTSLDDPDGLPTPMTYPGERFEYPSLSDRYVWFWNALAQRMGSRCPGRYIGAYAYSNYNHPPLRETLSKRVIIGYVGFNYLNADYCERSRQDWAGWSQTGCKLYLRPNFLLAGHGFPLNYARRLGRDVQRCYQTGMLGTDFDSMTHQYAAQAPIFHVLTALLWDPDRDVDVLYRQFMTAAYGPAADAMEAYWDRLETLTDAIATHQDEGADHDRTTAFHRLAPQSYSPDVLAELRGLLANARTHNGGDEDVLARIDCAAVAIDYAEIQTQVLLAMRRYTKTGDNIEDLAALLKRKRAFLQKHLTDFTVGVHHVYWREGRSTRHRRMYGTNLLNELSHPRELAQLIRWRFQKDPEDAGVSRRWFASDVDDSDWAAITALAFWEQQGQGDYDGVGWYRTEIDVPQDWSRYDALSIHFGAVDESFRLYIDGAFVHESTYDAAGDPDLWKKPRVVDVTEQLTQGARHLIAVRVHDSGGAGGLWKPVFIVHD